MNPRNRNALLALVSILFVAAIALPMAQREAAKPPTHSRTAPRRTVTPEFRLDRFRAYTEPTTNFLGQTVPLSVVPYLASAVRCAQQVEKEVAKHPEDANHRRLLKGLGKRLFQDDYAYAALGVEGMHRTNALEAYAQIDQQSVLPATGPLPPKAAADSLEAHYDRIVRYGHTSGFSNVVEVLAKYTGQNPLRTDLFKDAALLSVSEHQFDGWITEFQRQEAHDVKVQTERFSPNPEFLDSIQSGFGQQAEEVRQIQESYRNVFTYRLSERHGLTDPEMIKDIVAIDLGNAGPELVIPTVEP